VELIKTARDVLDKDLKKLEHEYKEFRENAPAYSADAEGHSTIGKRIEQLQVNGRLGNDTFYVVPAKPVETGTGGAAIPPTPGAVPVPIDLLIDIEGGPAPNAVALVVGNFALGAGPNPVFTGVSTNLSTNAGSADFVIVKRCG
jgi:hypothetical protein